VCSVAIALGPTRLLWLFLPYIAVGIVHLAALFLKLSALADVTKPLLMPALLIAFVIGLRVRTSRVAILAAVGFALSWAGDVLLASPGDVGFLLGLISFLLSHVVFIVIFLRYTKLRRMPWLALLIALWWAVLIVLLAPSIGVLLAPVVIYGLVLGFYFAASLGCNRYLAIGAFLVLASDSVLAFKLFLPHFSLWQHDVIIMLPYIVGQGLIAIGVVFATAGGSTALVANARTRTDSAGK
jgi:uncharacterized membrane protein YhhN